MITEALKQLLKDSGAADIEHSRHTFYDHLVGVHDLLEAWGSRSELCLAGLFHSFYGTQDFKSALLGYHKREKLKKALGVEAEHLAYLFSVCDRRTFFANLNAITQGDEGQVVDRVGKKYVTVSHHVLLDLIELEVANWLDQVPPLCEASEQGLAPIRSVLPQLKGVISIGATNAVERYFSGLDFRNSGAAQH